MLDPVLRKGSRWALYRHLRRRVRAWHSRARQPEFGGLGKPVGRNVAAFHIKWREV